MMMKKIISVTLILSILSAQFVFSNGEYVEVLSSSEAFAHAKYSFSETIKETPKDFNDFLGSCLIVDRIQMLQALQYLPSAYITMSPELVLKAVESEELDSSSISPKAIRKALIWRAYNKFTYCIRGDSEIDYHGIVQWVARKSGIDDQTIKRASTFALEKEVAEKYFGGIWEHLTPEQRRELIDIVNGDEAEERRQVEERRKAEILWNTLKPIPTVPPDGGRWFFIVLAQSTSEVDTVRAFVMTVNMIKMKKVVNCLER